MKVRLSSAILVEALPSRPALDPKGRLHIFCHAIPGRWHVMGVTQSAGLSLRWFRDTFGVTTKEGRDPYDQLTAEAAAVPPGSDGLLWTPYLMGERTPHLDPHARGAWVGITASHTCGHMVRSILEGVAFSLRDTFTIFGEIGVPVNRIRLGGGGAISALWRHIQADIYGHAVETVAAEEGAAYGAAILAGVGAGMWPSVEAACDTAIRVAEKIPPQASVVPKMTASYEKYRRVYPATRDIYKS